MPSQPIPISAPTNQASSTGSGSPQTPLASSTGVGLSTSAGHSLFGKWNAFSAAKPVAGAATSPPNPSLNMHHDDDLEHHDSLEFGDLGDLRARGWAAAQQQGARRAMSVSVSPTQTLGGFKSLSPPQATALRDNLARGEGALRRLSLGGFGRVSSHRCRGPTHPRTTRRSARPGLALHGRHASLLR